MKRLNPLLLQDDKIPPKSPRPRRNIWLSRSQSDIFSRKPGRKVNVQDPYYNPGPRGGAKVNPFSAREDLKGGKIKFFDVPSKSVFSLMFDLHSPRGSMSSYPPPQTGAAWLEPWQLPGRQCHSLPVSPQPALSEAFSAARFEAGDAVLRAKSLAGWAKKYAVPEIPPYRPRAAGEWAEHGERAESEEDMDCAPEDNPTANGNGEDMDAEDDAPALFAVANQNPLPMTTSVEPQELSTIVLAPCRAATSPDVPSRCGI